MHVGVAIVDIFLTRCSQRMSWRGTEELMCDKLIGILLFLGEPLYLGICECKMMMNTMCM